MKKYLIHGLIKIVSFLGKDRYLEFNERRDEEIIFVMGMFRSGTSLTCNILSLIGFKIGPDWTLLRSQGALKYLNPKGFFEDFLFVHLGRYWTFKILNKSADNPPTTKDMEDFKMESIQISDFINFCEFVSKEERISFKNRLKLYLLLVLKKSDAFFYFSKEVVKVPILVPYYKCLKEWLPKSSFLIVIRNPHSTIKSSKQLTQKANIELYNNYYESLLKMSQLSKTDINIISYDNLLSNPKYSIENLARKFNRDYSDEIIKIIDRKLIRNSEHNYETLNNTYEILLSKSINK